MSGAGPSHGLERRLWPADVPAEFVKLMESVCTEKELDVLEWKARGYGLRKIAEQLGIHRSSVQDRLARAERKVRQARPGQA